MNTFTLPPSRKHNGRPLQRARPTLKPWPMSGKNRAQRHRLSAAFSAMAAGRRFS